MRIVRCDLHSTWDTFSLRLLFWLKIVARKKLLFWCSSRWRAKRLYESSNPTCCANGVKIWNNLWGCEGVSVERSVTAISWGKCNAKRAAMLEGSACAWGGRGTFQSLWVLFFLFFFCNSMYNLKHCKSTELGKRRCTREPECPHSRVTDWRPVHRAFDWCQLQPPRRGTSCDIRTDDKNVSLFCHKLHHVATPFYFFFLQAPLKLSE